MKLYKDIRNAAFEALKEYGRYELLGVILYEDPEYVYVQVSGTSTVQFSKEYSDGRPKLAVKKEASTVFTRIVLNRLFEGQ